VRIIATTNRDLAAEAAAGTFRRDLYYRLGVIPILIPPLRERVEDIPLLATRFAIKCAHEMGKEVRGISAEALRFLQAQEWPGNVRELQHAVERAVILSDDPILPAHAFDSARYGLTPVHGTQTLPRATPSVPSRAAGAGIPDATGATVSTSSSSTAGADPGVTLTTLNVAEVEKTLIARALEMAGGNRTRASELLGISVRTLRNKLNTPIEGAEEDQAG